MVGPLALALAFGAVACAGERGSTGVVAPSADAGDDGELVLVLGSSATRGAGLDDPLRDAWPQLLLRAGEDDGRILVNAASSGTGVREAQAEQVPLARELVPDVVAVLVGSYDAARDRDPRSVESEMVELVAALRAAGAGRVLLGTLPPLGEAADRAPYDDAIRRAAAAGGATLVDLAHLSLRAGEEPYLPDESGHAAIAAEFLAVLAPGG